MGVTTASTSYTSDCRIPVRDELFPALLKLDRQPCQTKYGKPFSLKQEWWGFHFFLCCCVRQSITCSSIYDSFCHMCSQNSGQLFSHLCYSLKMSLVNNLHKIAFLYHTCNLTYTKEILVYKSVFFLGKVGLRLESSRSVLEYNIQRQSLQGHFHPLDFQMEFPCYL